MKALCFADVNECLGSNVVCSSDATCNNVVGGYTCQCNTGFTGNGTICLGRPLPILFTATYCCVHFDRY